jgi:hypothetical protein
MTYEYIDNFDYQEGQIYNLKVKFVERTALLPEDVPKNAYNR